MSERHCATCRCGVTITGSIAGFLDADPLRIWSTKEIAKAIRYKGEHLQATLDRMAKERKIEMLSRGRYRSMTTMADLREAFERNTL